MNRPSLKAEKREILGRKVKQLRQEGVLPANIYGKKVKSQAVQVKLVDFEKVFGQVGETGLVELVVNRNKRPVLIHNAQVDPVTDSVIHIDFLQVDLKEKVSAAVPIELAGEAPAEKEGKGTLVQYINEIEVEALPINLPEKFEINLSGLAEVDAVVQVKDLKVDKTKVEIQSDPGQIIVKVEPPRKVEEEVSPAEEEVPVEEETAPGEEVSEEREAKPKEGEVSSQEKIDRESKEGKEEKPSSVEPKKGKKS